MPCNLDVTGPDPASRLTILAPAVEYWLDLAIRAGGTPGLRDVDLALLGALVPAARLIEARRETGHSRDRLRYREIGGSQVEVPGRDVTEEALRLGWADCEAAMQALAGGTPVGIGRRGADESDPVEVLALPVTVDTNRRNDLMLLIVLAPLAFEGARENSPIVATRDTFVRL